MIQSHWLQTSSAGGMFTTNVPVQQYFVSSMPSDKQVWTWACTNVIQAMFGLFAFVRRFIVVLDNWFLVFFHWKLLGLFIKYSDEMCFLLSISRTFFLCLFLTLSHFLSSSSSLIGFGDSPFYSIAVSKTSRSKRI